MRLQIDQQTVEIDGDTLGPILAAAQSHLQEQGRIVVEVLVDGQPLVGDAIDQRQDEPVDGRDIQLHSADPRDLAVETLTRIDTRLAETLELQTEAATLLQQDQMPDALRQLSTIIEVWLQVQQAVLQSCQIANVDFIAVEVDGLSANELTEQLISSLNALKANIESGDASALADALQHEWPETVASWRQLLARLIHTIQPA